MNPCYFLINAIIIMLLPSSTRMHSSRMRTSHFSDRLGEGGVVDILLPDTPLGRPPSPTGQTPPLWVDTPPARLHAGIHPPPPWTEGMTHICTKHYLPATVVAGGKYYMTRNILIQRGHNNVDNRKHLTLIPIYHFHHTFCINDS